MGNTQAKPCFSDEVNLNHFRLLRVVGRGAFGKVRIVERKDTGLTFALKYIRKEDVVKSESVRNILRERRMLEHLNYQFICNLRYSFQDIEYMYLVVDLMNGGDLRFHISRKTFTEEAVRFWISELGLALRYIHSHAIVHRDVKPDNVLLDAEGHVHLADFNVASDFQPGKPLTSKSGTLAYLAPEVYKGKGYSSGADWWSLGVLFYECIYNKRPFEGQTSLALQAQIIKANPKFPVTDPQVSMVCMHAISSALEEDPDKRMGCAKDEGFSSFTDNPFFRAIDFHALERKEIEPVFVPSSEKTNFDATYDLEELLLEEAPLEARTRRQKPREQLRGDATEKEIREEEMHKLIEAQFTPFDYTAAVYQRLVGATDSNNTDPNAAQNTSSLAPVELQQENRLEAENNVFQSIGENKAKKNRNPKSCLSTPSASPPMKNVPRPTEPQLVSNSNRQGIQTTVVNESSRSPLSPYQASYSWQQNPKGTRKESLGGGIQVALCETGSWSELAKNDTTLPADAKPTVKSKSAGIPSFFSRRKGRGNGPKQHERGILGKEGARVIINSGE